MMACTSRPMTTRPPLRRREQYAQARHIPGMDQPAWHQLRNLLLGRTLHRRACRFNSLQLAVPFGRPWPRSQRLWQRIMWAWLRSSRRLTVLGYLQHCISS